MVANGTEGARAVGGQAGEGVELLLERGDVLGDDGLGGEQGVGGDDEADRLEVAEPLLVGEEGGVVGHGWMSFGSGGDGPEVDQADGLDAHGLDGVAALDRRGGAAGLAGELGEADVPVAAVGGDLALLVLVAEVEAELVGVVLGDLAVDAGDLAGDDLGEDDAAQLASARAAVDEGIAERTLWVWEAPDGEVVSMVGARLPAYGVSRVGPVYTPPTHRGRGYAGAATALASAGMRELGATEVCLFTDLDNPTSNGVYRRIGYVPVLDTGNFRLVAQ